MSSFREKPVAHSRFIYIADRSIRADGDERVKTCFEKASVVCARPLDLFFCFLAFGNITGSRKDTGNVSGIVFED